MLYAEDLIVGSSWPTGTYVTDADEIKSFAGQWDPVPIHLDDAIAEASPFGGLIASGMHILAIAVRLAYEGFFTNVALLAGRGLREMRIRKPLRPGMPVSGRIEVLESRLRDDGRGVCVFAHELRDDAGDLVLRYEVDALVYRRDGRAEQA